MTAVDLVYPALEEDKRAGQERRSGKGLALGYEVIEVGEDEDLALPLSVFYPPSHPKPAQARPQCFARKVSLGYCRRHSSGLDETTVDGELDLFTDDVLQELLAWLSWVETWASEAGERGEVDELHERLQSHLQHYIEPSPANGGTTTSVIPIVVVCTKAYLMDNAAEDVEVKDGASLFYTAPSLLKCYLLHRLYTVPPSLNPPPTSPFNHRANVLDRGVVMVPSGWDSWLEISVLRDGFGPAQAEWKVSLSRYKYIAKSAGQEPEEDDGEPLEEFWQALLPSFASPPPQSPANLTTVTEPSQNFFSRQLDRPMKDLKRDSRQSFRHLILQRSLCYQPRRGWVQQYRRGIGEGDDGKEGELKDKIARRGRKDGKAAPGTPAPAMPNEALHTFGLLANRGKTVVVLLGLLRRGLVLKGRGRASTQTEVQTCRGTVASGHVNTRITPSLLVPAIKQALSSTPLLSTSLSHLGSYKDFYLYSLGGEADGSETQLMSEHKEPMRKATLLMLSTSSSELPNRIRYVSLSQATNQDYDAGQRWRGFGGWCARTRSVESFRYFHCVECKERPIAFLSGKFTPTEINYHITDKELFPMVVVAVKCRHWLMSSEYPVTYVTDHKALSNWKVKYDTNGRQARWSEILLRKESFVVYQPKNDQKLLEESNARLYETILSHFDTAALSKSPPNANLFSSELVEGFKSDKALEAIRQEMLAIKCYSCNHNSCNASKPIDPPSYAQLYPSISLRHPGETVAVERPVTRMSQ
ncbi:hypothetical protein B9479_007042 [Cryptococcus floricola]|uniref:Reverse transcriptase RNase H-like domain-containing protein n=1 Tax=Cryptococcus floricola TaxID=2591691 RepID=A0A5D3ANT5_9TREE|nr:hypothetical protein B9479_007042 [Cryptococcus floricola]